MHQKVGEGKKKTKDMSQNGIRVRLYGDEEGKKNKKDMQIAT